MYRILLVDDEILVREVIRQRIQWNELGFELAADCENGREAIRYLETEPIDLVLTDIYMPHVDGLKLSRYVCENCPGTAVVIFSGYNDFEYAREAMKYNVSEYLLKPVTAQELSDALTRVRRRLDKERSENNQMEQLRKNYRNYARNETIIVSRILSRLVQGTQCLEENLSSLRELDIELKGESYQVLVLDLAMKHDGALMAFAVENIAREILEEKFCSIVFHNTDSRVHTLICHQGNAAAYQEQVRFTCREIQKAAEQLMRVTLSIGIGCPVATVNELPLSCAAAADVLKLCYTKGRKAILDSQLVQPEKNTLRMEEYIKELRMAFLKHNPDAAKEIVARIISVVQSSSYTREEIVVSLHQLLLGIRNSISEVNHDFSLSDHVLTAVTAAADFTEAIAVVADYVNQGFSAIAAAAESSNERLAKLAMEYLHKNYNRSSLVLNDVSEYLNISTSYFSSLFKRTNDRTFIEVLTDIRMEKAMLLLSQTELKNYEIAERVGFSDPHYFGIVFKKMTGLSPKAYARRHRHE